MSHSLDERTEFPTGKISSFPLFSQESASKSKNSSSPQIKSKSSTKGFFKRIKAKLRPKNNNNNKNSANGNDEAEGEEFGIGPRHGNGKKKNPNRRWNDDDTVGMYLEWEVMAYDYTTPYPRHYNLHDSKIQRPDCALHSV